MSTSPELHIDKKDFDDAVKAVTKTHNLLLATGLPGPTLMAAEAACAAVVFANVIKVHPEGGTVYLDNWLANLRRMALKAAQ